MKRFILSLVFIGGLAAAPFAQQQGPVLERQVPPSYTQSAWDARIEGSVLLSGLVRTDGTVGDITVTKSLDKERGLDDQAVKAFNQWRFKPGTVDGKAVAVRVDVEIKFTLARGPRPQP